MTLLAPGTELDGFRVLECLHSGSMAHLYSVEYANGAANPGFALLMKVPRMTAGDGAENIVGFEVELTLLPRLNGRHVPRFVAAGDIARTPYIVMEHVHAPTLQQWLDQPDRPDVAQIARLGSAVAHALHALHQQNVCHLDLKPRNVLMRSEDDAVLIDFGLSCHAQLPDLLAEELRIAVGSPAWMAPEQVVGVRGDPRSDVFALGVILYELATGELPFGAPTTAGGLRQRLWMSPVPPRARRPELPAWLQEVILRCLEPEAAQRYPSAAHLAFDLDHPQQVTVGERGQRLRGPSWRTHLQRWLKAAGMHYTPSPLPTQQIEQTPIVMVAVPHGNVSDALLYSLREAAARSLGIRPGARLACVTVIAPTGADGHGPSETLAHRQHQLRLRQWAQGLDLSAHQGSFHVLESSDVAQALVRYARGNNVSILILGAAMPGMTSHTQRIYSDIPLRVAQEAPCTVILVKQAVPFAHLADDKPDEPARH